MGSTIYMFKFGEKIRFSLLLNGRIHLLKLMDILALHTKTMKFLQIFFHFSNVGFLMTAGSLLVGIILGRLSVLFFMTAVMGTLHKSMQCLQKSR